MLSWSTFEPVFNDCYKTHVEYEKINGEQKIILRNKRQTVLLTNDDTLEEETDGGPWKKEMSLLRNGEAGGFC
jgi:hypothetical protein